MADIRALANACFARAQADPGFLAYRGNGPDKPTRNYAVFHFSSGRPYTQLHSGSQTNLDWGFRVVCVGLREEDACLAVAARVRALFLNWSPFPSDASMSWLDDISDDVDPVPEDDTDPVRYSSPLRYTLTSRS